METDILETLFEQLAYAVNTSEEYEADASLRDGILSFRAVFPVRSTDSKVWQADMVITARGKWIDARISVVTTDHTERSLYLSGERAISVQEYDLKEFRHSEEDAND